MIYSAAIGEQKDTIFEPWNQPASPRCTVGIFQDGEMVFTKDYGYAVIDGGAQEPISLETVFYAGSLAEQFTASAITWLHLRSDGDLDLSSADYLPELYPLLSLNDTSLDKVVPFQAMAVTVIGQSYLNFEAGSNYIYSNNGYLLLAEIVERVFGQILREYTKENLFRTLGTNHTYFHGDRHHETPNKALSCHFWGGSFTGLTAVLVPVWAREGSRWVMLDRIGHTEKLESIRQDMQNLGRRDGVGQIRIGRFAPDTTLEGKRFSEVAVRVEMDPTGAALTLIRSGSPRIVSFNIHEDDVYQFSEGMVHVLVNGRFVIKDEVFLTDLHGIVLRKNERNQNIN